MKASEVYLRAAQAVAKKNHYSCCAINDVVGMMSNSPEKLRYESFFKIAGDCDSAWLLNDPDLDDEHSWRVLALLFMHQIAKDEERK